MWIITMHLPGQAAHEVGQYPNQSDAEMNYIKFRRWLPHPLELNWKNL
jgi:hypothetical protein